MPFEFTPQALSGLVLIRPRVFGDPRGCFFESYKRSATFGRWFGVTLSEENHLMTYVPPGFGHGFVVLSESAQFLYQCTQEYDPSADRGVRWDDPELAIERPLRDVTVSAKDAALPLLAQAALFGTSLP